MKQVEHRTHSLGRRNKYLISPFHSDLILRILYQYPMMRSFLCHLFSLTTIVATLSLASFDQGMPDGDAVQLMTNIPTGNSEDPFEDTALGLDNSILGWGEVRGTEQALANNDACSETKPSRKRRRGETNHCSPTVTPPPLLQFRPDSQQDQGSELGSERKKTGGSTTTTDQQDSGQSGLLRGKARFDTLQLVPWSTTQSTCPENKPVAVCAGADLQPWELDKGWRQNPFSNPQPSPMELLYWPYCRLCTLYISFHLKKTRLFFSNLSLTENNTFWGKMRK